jgi:hypothetical protein
MIRSTLRLSLSVALAGLVSACSSSSDPAPAKTSLGTQTAGGLTVELVADAPLSTGLNSLYASVKDAGGAVVADATVDWMPTMTMTSMSHSAPMVGSTAFDAADKLYPCDVVFQMASSDMDHWTMDVAVTRPGAAPVTVAFPLTVPDGGRTRSFTYTDPGTSVATKYVVSFNLKSAAKVGSNPVAVTLHRSVNMGMMFAPVDDATFTIAPYMPSMSHGADGSVAPTPTSTPGVYEGQVSFSMAGDWETTLTVTRGGTLVSPTPSTLVFKTSF